MVGRGTPLRGWPWVLFAAACIINLVGVYWPSQPGPDALLGIPHLDKVAHLGLFAAVAFTGLLAGLRSLPLGAVLVGHAVLSELVQAAYADRSGDPFDAVADLGGVAVGLLVGHVVLRGRTAGFRGRDAGFRGRAEMDGSGKRRDAVR